MSILLLSWGQDILEKNLDVMSRQDSVLTKCFTSDMKRIFHMYMVMSRSWQHQYPGAGRGVAKGLDGYSLVVDMCLHCP